jgi:hypothetical protein
MRWYDEEKAFAVTRGFHKRSGRGKRGRQGNSWKEDPILVRLIDRIDDVPLIGPEPDAKSFSRHVLGKSGAPGTSTNHSDAIDCLHNEKKRPKGSATTNGVCGSVIWRADYRNPLFPLSMNRPVQNAC